MCYTSLPQVAVGEKHSLALQTWYVPPLPSRLCDRPYVSPVGGQAAGRAAGRAGKRHVQTDEEWSAAADAAAAGGGGGSGGGRHSKNRRGADRHGRGGKVEADTPEEVSEDGAGVLIGLEDGTAVAGEGRVDSLQVRQSGGIVFGMGWNGMGWALSHSHPPVHLSQ